MLIYDNNSSKSFQCSSQKWINSLSTIYKSLKLLLPYAPYQFSGTKLKNIQYKSYSSYKKPLKLRSKQTPPRGKWSFWLIMAGRGFGKTLAGAHCIVEWVKTRKKTRICIIGDTYNQVRQVMINGPSGILNLCDQIGLKYKYYSSQNLIVFPNGVKIFGFSSEKPDSLRGFQFDCVWADEFAKFNKVEEVLQQLIFCCRAGETKIIITTTPRPIPALQNLIKRGDCRVVTGSSYENARNLPNSYLNLIREFDHTTLGKQEIYGEIIEKDDNSPWSPGTITHIAVEKCNLRHYTLGIDPSVSNGNETGMILAAYDTSRGKIVILEDLSVSREVKHWIPLVADLVKLYNIDYLAVETNQGGDLLEYTINHHLSHSIPIEKFFARENKRNRALPIACLYKKTFIVHNKPLEQLEKQMLFFNGSLDRVDALVWAVELILRKIKPTECKNISNLWII